MLPVVTLDDGPSATTNDPTPTIAGTSDARRGTIIRVSVDAQALRALVHAGGAWNMTGRPRWRTAPVPSPPR